MHKYKVIVSVVGLDLFVFECEAKNPQSAEETCKQYISSLQQLPFLVLLNTHAYKYTVRKSV